MRLKHLLIALFSLLVSAVHAQNFEWLKAYGTINGYESPNFMCANPDGGCTFTFDYQKAWFSSGTKDTIHFDSHLYERYNNGPPFLGYLLRMDSTGQVIKSHMMGELGLGRVVRSPDGDYFVAGYVTTPNIVTDSSTIFNTRLHLSNGKLIIARFDKDLNLKWFKQIGNKNTAIRSITFNNDELYFTMFVKDTTIIGGKNFYSANTSNLFGKMDARNGNVLWGKLLNFELNDNSRNGNLIINGSKIYIATNGGVNGYKIGNDSIAPATGVILCFDTSGNYDKSYSLKAKFGITFSSITTDGQNLFICGNFRDSVYWTSNKVIAPSYPTGSSKSELFAACFSLSFTPKWFFRPEVVTQNTSGHVDVLNSCVYNNGFIYYQGHINDEIQIDSNNFSGDAGRPVVFIMKSDIRGNILWATTANASSLSTISAITAWSGQGVFCGGRYYSDTIRLKKLWAYSPGGWLSQNGFITKISDNAIIRGQVKAGPYCSGDSILVPYIKIGQYDTSNYFMAQLSNEEGNFDKDYFNLGRIKSNADGVVKGRIPLSKISSSGKYRIRIMSTSPAVQSYYKADTLRLLIYSKDKANPGRDTAICPGDSVLLRTYGGTKWTWSPKYRMQDSSNYKTLVWPDKTTKYKIIIADSSGCGAADTAYKTIIVRKDPKITILTKKDTAVCLGATVPVVAAFTQGDSTGYNWIWYSVSATGIWTELATGQKQLKDTLNFKMPVGIKDSQQLILFLSDGCNKKTDFKYFTIFITKSKAKASIAKDTVVCPSTTAALIAQFTQGSSSNYNWRWYDVPTAGTWTALSPIRSNQTADTLNYTLPLAVTKPKKIGIRVQDNCSGMADTAYQIIKPADTLQLQLNTKDTQLCKGNAHTFKASGKGGNPKGYRYTWTNTNNDTLSKSDSLIYSAKSTDTIRVTLSDGCMAKTNSQQFKITVLPEINSRIKLVNSVVGDTSICHGIQLALHATTTGGKGSGYGYNWTINNTTLSNNDSITINPAQYTHDTGGIVTLQLITTDNCTTVPDTNTIQITVRPKLQLQILTLDSICYKTLFTMKAKAVGGIQSAYTYKWLNQQLLTESTKDSLQLNYFAPGQAGTKIYSVILNDGCSQPDTVKVTRVLLPQIKLSLSSNNTCPNYSSILSAKATGGKGYGYTYTWWKNGTVLPATKDTVTVYANGQANTYRVTATEGCSNSGDTLTMQMGVKPIIQLTTDRDTGCNPMLMTYTFKTTYNKPFNWILYTGIKGNDSIIGNESQLSQTVNYTTGIYTARLKVRTPEGCEDWFNGPTITVHPQPIANFIMTPEFLTLSHSEVKIENRSSNAARYKWLYPPIGTSTDTNIAIKYTDTGRYYITLIAISNHQCTDSVTRIIMLSHDLQLLVPDAFSPNGDGINDVFKPEAVGIKTIKVSIFNRWGEMMYQSDSKTEGWDGTFLGKDAQQGMYLYTIEAKGLFGPVQYFKGMLLLMR
ncbi:MAG: gliding motility-associated C-terminal domain-containing protein [Bacteroidota bacterium]